MSDSERSLTNIDDAIREWHEGAGENYSLHHYLGMSWDTYKRWSYGNLSSEELAEYGYYEGD